MSGAIKLAVRNGLVTLAAGSAFLFVQKKSSSGGQSGFVSTLSLVMLLLLSAAVAFLS